MRRVFGVYLIVGVSLLVLPGAAWAQLSTAELSGRVTDESGGVLPGVTVTATQTDTGAARTAVTDAAGNYLIPNLPTGPYRLEVALQGFRRNLNNAQFGRITAMAGSPRIMQFGIKYGF